MNQATLDQLRSNEFLQEVPEDQLQWLLDNANCLNLNEGDFLFQRGDPIDKMYIFIEGEVEIRLQQGNSFRVFDRLGPGSISGYLPYSRAVSATGFGEVVAAGCFLAYPKDLVKSMTLQHYDLTKALVNLMTSRTREFTISNYQNEKLMALGKLSAGLAHELNSKKEQRCKLVLIRPIRFIRIRFSQN